MHNITMPPDWLSWEHVVSWLPADLGISGHPKNELDSMALEREVEFNLLDMRSHGLHREKQYENDNDIIYYIYKKENSLFKQKCANH